MSNPLPLSRRLGLGLMIAIFLLGISVNAQKPRQIPAAKLPGTEEELKWWQAVQAAGQEAVAVRVRKDQAISKAKRRYLESRGFIGSSEEENVIPRDELAKLNAEIAATTKNFLSLLQESVEKSYRVPLPDNKYPIILHRTRPKYSDEARRKKVNGSIVISLTYLANGEVGDVTVDQGLGAGLDEKATEIAHNLLFLPAVKDGLFVPGRYTLEMSFNIYTR
jgi:TonB family protein